MPGILFISGGDDFARAVYRAERRAYWSMALPLVLEKHGYLGFSVAGPEALEDPRTWQRHDVVLVARLPEGSWTETAARRASKGRAGVLVEGPLPRVLLDFLRISEAEPAEPAASLKVTNQELAASDTGLGVAPAGRLCGYLSRPTPLATGLHWRGLPQVPIDDDQAAAWQAFGWDVQRWSPVSNKRVLVYLRPAEAERPRWPAIVRRGSLLGCAFGLFAFLGQSHTSEPFEPGQVRSWPRTLGVESLLLGLIDMLHRHAGAVRPRLRPWPAGASWVLSVRHDFDRPMPPERVRDVIAGHASAGTSATWYWRARHLLAESNGSDARAAVQTVAAAPDHEVALHTERTWAGAEEERAAIEAALGSSVAGSTAHGDPTCFRFQGAPNPLWAANVGLSYTELVDHGHLHPHRFPALRPDGTIEPLDVICLPGHESFDLTTKPGGFTRERILQYLPVYRRGHGLMQILNHPDIHTDELFALLRELPRDGRLDWTAAQVADWWRRTHVSHNLTLAFGDDGAPHLTSSSAVSGLVVELMLADGRVECRTLDLEPGIRVPVG